MKEDVIHQEDERYYKKSEQLSLKEIILQHIRKISEISCQELTASYWQKKPIKIGTGVMMTEIYHPDLREAYCNAIDFLLDMTMPYVDEEFQNKLKELYGTEEKEFEEAKKNKISQEDWIKIKLRLRRKLFGEIMLFYNRDNFFEGEMFGE